MSTPPQASEFWRVSSYGYPNPFSSDASAKEAWETFRSFYDNDQGSYSSLKTYWDGQGPRRLDSHAVESWKAAFEEFGLLYVISRSNKISITPGGRQLFAAVASNHRKNFAWVGLNLLFRYPLQGPPKRRPKSPAHASSDILPYRFLYSTMRDLGDYFWWTELERVICLVFQTSNGHQAIDSIRKMRADISKRKEYPLPVAEDKRRGVFYNSLNQIANHAGMNHFILSQKDDDEHYGASESKRRHLINREFLGLVSIALGDSATPSACDGSALYVDRLPTAPAFTDEQDYFNYLGAEVPSLVLVQSSSEPQAFKNAGDTVFVLQENQHYNQVSAQNNERVIQGNPLLLCRIARNHRVILSSDRNWTYNVTGKDLVGSDTVKLTLRRAKPITNFEPLETLLGGDGA